LKKHHRKHKWGKKHKKLKKHKKSKKKKKKSRAAAAAYVEGLYNSILCRHSEPAGLDGWVAAIVNGGKSNGWVRQQFLHSPEYKSRHGRPCGAPGKPVKKDRTGATAYVESLYNSLLCRHSEPAGLKGWVDAIVDGGKSHSWIREQFLGSAEYKSKNGQGCTPFDVKGAEAYVEALYKTLLCRHSEPAGLNGWVNALRGGTSRDAVRQGFIGSAEYQSRGGKPCPPPFDEPSARAFVENLYQTLLCRNSEPAGLKGWVATLRAGTSRDAVVQGFIGSAEYKAREGRKCGEAAFDAKAAGDWVESLYNTLLCRHSDAGGKAGWIGALRTGKSQSWVRDGFLNSAEYKLRGGRACGQAAAAAARAAPPVKVLPPGAPKTPPAPAPRGSPAPPPPPKPFGAPAPPPPAIAPVIPPVVRKAAPKPFTPPKSATVKPPFDWTHSPDTRYFNKHITDYGFAHDRQWTNICTGKHLEDYGRWVGVAPHVWFSIARKDCPNQYSARGEFVLEDGKIKRGPKFRGCSCQPPKTEERKWTPPAKAPWRAPPVEQKHYDNILHCRSSAGGTCAMKCPAGMQISVLDSSWGAGQGVWQSTGYIVKGACHQADSLQRVANACNGKSSCGVEADSSLGKPCTRPTELLTTYQCSAVAVPAAKVASPAAVQIQYPGIIMAEAVDGAKASLACPGENVIAVLDASYGRSQGFYKSNGFIRKGVCHAASTPKELAEKCNGQPTCSVLADANAFPVDGCGDGQRKLKLTYRCSPPDAVPQFEAPAPPAPRVWTVVPKQLEAVAPQPAAGPQEESVVNIGGSEVHIHVTQLSAPEPNAAALGAVEDKLDRLHDTAMTKIEGILDDLDKHRVQKKPCLKKLQNTIDKFKSAFVSEAQEVEKLTHKFSYADDAPTLV
jgi:hypothetical protein